MDMVFKRLGHPQKKLHELSVGFDNLTPGTKVNVGDILFAKLKKFDCPLVDAPLDQFQSLKNPSGTVLDVAALKEDILKMMPPGSEECCLGPSDIRVEVCNKDPIKQVKTMIVVLDGKAAKDEQLLAQGTVDALVKRGKNATLAGVSFSIRK